MEFPIWNNGSLGGGFWVALIATLHVYIAHLAVGGGLFLIAVEIWAGKNKSSHMLTYLRNHTRFFLLLTMVFGGVTGVGIWFTISVLSPAATSLLIREFVFGWATEWVFFIGEIVALLIYYYTMEKMERKKHILIGFLYFVFAWLSLVVINGIITFMLTPGQWTPGSFWAGFFNPSYWPALVFRTFAALMITGLFGFLTAFFVKDKETRNKLARFCGAWVVLPIILVFASGLWYLDAIPAEAKIMMEGRLPELAFFMDLIVYFGPAILILGIIASFKLPRVVQITLALILVILGQLFFGAFEFAREAARKPYLISDVMYSNSIPVASVETIMKDGYLKTAKWVKNKEVTEENKLDAGRELFVHQCLACHSQGGVMNAIEKRISKYNHLGMNAALRGLGKVNGYMPHFLGLDSEREALAAFLVEVVLKKEKGKEFQAEIEELEFEMPTFDPDEDQYVLLAWNKLGMHCITDTGGRWLILPPANNLNAILIKRGDTPEIVTEGIEIHYQVEAGFENPSAHVDFWNNAEALFGAKLEKNKGLTGNGLSGVMKLAEDGSHFHIDKIPIVPYHDNGTFNPYPLFTIKAVAVDTGEELMATKTVAPTSTETGCANCHGGNLYENGMPGISHIAADDILAVHDRMSGTKLVQQVKEGKPVLCQSCHADPALGTEGKPELLNMSAAIHGFHANYMGGMSEQACNSCHPSGSGGYTRCMRGYHNDMGITCVDCHGHIEEHALSLLSAEKAAGKPGADRLMKHLNVVQLDDKADIKPRTPWLNEPDCLGCHVDFQTPEEYGAFNNWVESFDELYRNRKDDMDALMCIACHGSTHAIYPATNPFGNGRDNIQPLQYMGEARAIGGGNCLICHTEKKDWSGHHDNMIKD